MMRIPAIMYHDVIRSHYDESGWAGNAAARYKLHRSEFEKHLSAISGNGLWRAVLATHALHNPSPNTFCFTIDDGGGCSIYVADRLEALGWRGHFFITTDRIGKPAFAMRQEIREIHERGHSIGSHTATHPAWISKLPHQTLFQEWQRSTSDLADIIGQSVTIGSVPGGYYAPRVAKAAAASGISILFNSEPTVITTKVNNCWVLGRFTIRRGDSAQKAAALVAGLRAYRMRQNLAWKTKGAIKHHARPLWDSLIHVVNKTNLSP